MSHRERLQQNLAEMATWPEAEAEARAAELLDFIAARDASQARERVMASLNACPEEDEAIGEAERQAIEAALADDSPGIPAELVFQEAGL